MLLLEYFRELSLHPKNAEEIKGLILQLAIQGKLTANWRAINSNVEPASFLLKKIEEEKAQLISQKKIKKEKAIDPISKEEIPFGLPENWIWSKLIEISSINGGFAFKSSNYIDEGARVIRISDFDELGFKNHKVVRHGYTDDLLPYVLEDKNILIAMTGGTVGKSFFVDQVDEVMVVNQRVATIKIFKPICEAYVNCVIPTKLIQDVIEEAKNSTNDNISMSDIKGFNIPIPPLEEQKAIVEVVNELFAEVEQLEELTKKRISLKEDFVTSALRKLTESENTTQEWNYLKEHFSNFFTEKPNIKKLRETILQLAVQGKLTAKWREANPSIEDASELLKRIEAERLEYCTTPKEYERIKNLFRSKEQFEVKEGVLWIRAELICDFITKGTTPKKHELLEEGEVPFLKVYNIVNNKIDFLYKPQYVSEDVHNKLLKRSRLYPGDVLMNIVGPPLCKVAILPNDFPAWNMNQALAVFRPVKSIKNKYLYWVLAEGSAIRDVVTVGTAGQDNISLTQSRNLLIPVHSQLEQLAILEKVNSLMALIDELEQQFNNSQIQIEQLMQSCLKEVFENDKEVEKVQ